MITLYQDCQIISTTKDMYGKYVKSQPFSVKCRVKEEYQMVKNKASEEVISSLEFWFYKDTILKLDDLILYEGKEYPIISIENKRNTLGDITRKVVFV